MAGLFFYIFFYFIFIFFIIAIIFYSFKINPENENKLNLSTRIFLHSDYKIKQTYAKKIKKFYNTDVVSTNFNDSIRASDQINTWAAESTFGAMPQLTDSGR